MKFGKRLQHQIEETLPEWRDKFLSYKQLKKRIKLVAAECFSEPGLSDGQTCVESKGSEMCLTDSSILSAQQAEFVRQLNTEMEKFNSFFIEKEEEYVIRLQELKERIERAKQNGYVNSMQNVFTNEEMLGIWKDLVAFHGEMVLLENYSSLNYTGLVKILKKHDKHRGTILRLPFIQKVLHQPFYTTELLSKLVQECEQNLQSILPVIPLNGMHTGLKQETTIQEQRNFQEIPFLQCQIAENIYRSTLAALETIQHLRKGSSTYSVLSMPPLNGKDEELRTGISNGNTAVPC